MFIRDHRRWAKFGSVNSWLNCGFRMFVLVWQSQKILEAFDERRSKSLPQTWLYMMNFIIIKNILSRLHTGHSTFYNTVVKIKMFLQGIISYLIWISMSKSRKLVDFLYRIVENAAHCLLWVALKIPTAMNSLNRNVLLDLMNISVRMYPFCDRIVIFLLSM